MCRSTLTETPHGRNSIGILRRSSEQTARPWRPRAAKRRFIIRSKAGGVWCTYTIRGCRLRGKVGVLRTGPISANRILVELIEHGVEAEKRKQQELRDLAESLRRATA